MKLKTFSINKMAAYNVNSMLVIHLTAPSGVIQIDNEIPLQKVVLKQYSINFSTNSGNPSLMLFDLQPFTSAVINTNVAIKGAIPLLCNQDSRTTIQQLDIPIDTDRNVVRQFEYRVVKADGTFDSNFQTATLIFSYDNGVLY